MNLSGKYKLIDRDGIEAGRGTFTHFPDVNRLFGRVERYLHADKKAGKIDPPIVYQYDGFVIEDQICLAWNSPPRTICGVLFLILSEDMKALRGRTVFRSPETKEIVVRDGITYERVE
jgi:hypothetical protein